MSDELPTGPFNLPPGVSLRDVDGEDDYESEFCPDCAQAWDRCRCRRKADEDEGR